MKTMRVAQVPRPNGPLELVERPLPEPTATDVRAMNEVYPLQRVAEAYDRMMSGKARFRVVLTTGL